MQSITRLFITLVLCLAIGGAYAYSSNTMPGSTGSPESLNTGDTFLPPGTPFIDPNSAKQVACTNDCGNHFQLPSIDDGFHPAHTSEKVIKSEKYQQACLNRCLGH